MQINGSFNELFAAPRDGELITRKKNFWRKELRLMSSAVPKRKVWVCRL